MDKLELDKLDKLDKLNRLDEITTTLKGIKEAIDAKVSDTETRMVLKVRPKETVIALKPDLLPGGRAMADAVFVYSRGGKTVARIVEARAVWGRDTTWNRILEKFENTRGYVEEMVREGRLPSVEEYEHFVVVKLSKPLAPPENVRVVELTLKEVEGERGKL